MGWTHIEVRSHISLVFFFKQIFSPQKASPRNVHLFIEAIASLEITMLLNDTVSLVFSKFYKSCHFSSTHILLYNLKTCQVHLRQLSGISWTSLSQSQKKMKSQTYYFIYIAHLGQISGKSHKSPKEISVKNHAKIR